jgi:hypothetical protein
MAMRFTELPPQPLAHPCKAPEKVAHQSHYLVARIHEDVVAAVDLYDRGVFIEAGVSLALIP